MELVCGNYDVKLIPNPTDFILRLENRENARLFERTFFERDFAEYIVLGGLEFVVNLLKDVMPKQAMIKESPTQATFTVSWTPQFTRRIEFNFAVPAIKRDKASGDMDEVTARMKKMEKVAAEQKAALDRMLVLYDKINSHVTELEARCGDTITLPGCDYAIPTNVENLILIRDGGMLPDSRCFSSYYPSRFVRRPNGQGKGFNLHDPSWHPQHGTSSSRNWEEIPSNEKVYTFRTLSNITNLKYCKRLINLTICGSDKVTDYSSLAPNTLLTLNIIGDATCNDGTNLVYTSYRPALTDVSWIAKQPLLQQVSFRGCTQLVNVGPIKDLPNLKELDLRDTGVKNTGFLASSTLKITV